MPFLSTFAIDGFCGSVWAEIAPRLLRVDPAFWREILFKINNLSKAGKWVQKYRRASCVWCDLGGRDVLVRSPIYQLSALLY